MQGPELHTEKEILLRVAAGDEKAFAELFSQWAVWLSRYIFRLTGSTAMAEEIVQDVFMKIWTNREMLAEINNFKPFLLVVSRNQAYMALRRKIREETQFREYQDQTLLTFKASSAEQEYFSALDEAIDQLAPRVKEVYLMSRQERLTYQQIADRLGISKETVKTYLERATTSITKLLKSRFPELAAFALLIY